MISASARYVRLLAGAAAAMMCGFGLLLAQESSSATRYGFTPFPYDITLEAVDTTHELIGDNSTIYAFHIDDGIPWREVHENRPLPPKMRAEWANQVKHVPLGHEVYLALAPLAKDRRNLAPASEGSMSPKGFDGDRFDRDEVKAAYLNYARAAVEIFEPDYLNLGIEAGELAGKDRKAWERFTTLYDYVRAELKKDYPNLPMGISFSLHSLYGRKGVADRVRPLVDNSDYIGLSFYPYASSFGEKLHGARPLPPAPDQWREPLQWIRDYTDKPIAICETGYSSVDISVPAYDLSMKGDTQLQADYVADLGRIAARDGYLFVVWFLAIDYDALYGKIPEGDGSNRIWRNIGFLDAKLQPKPAWPVWQQIVDGKAPGALDESGSTRSSARSRESKVAVGFSDKKELFESSDRMELSDAAPGGSARSMSWSFDYGGEWHWATKSLKRYDLADATAVSFWIRSDRATPMFFQLEEKDGEAFFSMVLVEEGWQEVRLQLDELAVDPKKKKDGHLDTSQLTQILIADNAGLDEARGRRRIWIADLVFTNNER